MSNIKVLELIDVSKEFYNKKAVENISFHINKNDIFGFLGPNGAGKTTTIRMILNLLKQDTGTILINGKKADNRLRNSIGVCLDNEGLYENMTCRQNLEFFDRIYNSKKGRKERIEKLVEKMGLIEDIDKRVAEFSKGMKKRLGIARALINNPEIIILDEPLSGLDPQGQELLKNIIKELSKESTIFFSSHSLSDVQDICNKVGILNTSIVKFGDINELLKKPEKNLILTVNKNCNYEEFKFLNSITGILQFSINKNEINIEYQDGLDIGKVTAKLNSMDYEILNIEKKSKTIKDIYFESLGEAANND